MAFLFYLLTIPSIYTPVGERSKWQSEIPLLAESAESAESAEFAEFGILRGLQTAKQHPKITQTHFEIQDFWLSEFAESAESAESLISDCHLGPCSPALCFILRGGFILQRNCKLQRAVTEASYSLLRMFIF